MSQIVTSAFAYACYPDHVFPNNTLLNEQQGRCRLEQLKKEAPGSQEHLQLQNAFLKSGITEIALPDKTYKVNTSKKNETLPGGFGSSEHIAIGEGVQLRGLDPNTPLLQYGPHQVCFPHIIALAGDCYSVYGGAVSLNGGSDLEKTDRFVQSFEKLKDANIIEMRDLLAELSREYAKVKNSGLPHHCYSNQVIGTNHTLKKIKPDIEDLLIDNSDHFSVNAKEAYRIGHAYALEMARKATNSEKLKLAYALDAYACHFLTDLFSAGHVRNQRGALELFLEKIGFPSDWAKKLAGLLTAAQHEKDGEEGLNVSNGEGEHWRVYGDGFFFTPKNEKNRQMAIAAVQRSADEIFAAYENKDAPYISQMERLFPHADSINPPPIYSLDETNSLFLHRGSEKVEIKNKRDYILKGIPEAQKYLKESYINGFLNSYVTELFTKYIIDIQIPEIIQNSQLVASKVFVPRIEYITGFIWHVVGVATYYQAKIENEHLNEKMNEIGDISKETFNKSVEILKEVKKIKKELDHRKWSAKLKEIREPISTIRDKAHEYESYTTSLDSQQQEDAAKKLWNAHITLSRVFCEESDEQSLLAAYRERYLKQNNKATEQEIKIAVTLWFRQMLDYQIQAFRLYGILKILKNGRQHREQIQSQFICFQELIQKQLEINKSHLVENLICKSQGYIALQIEKERTARVGLQFLSRREEA